MPTTLTPYLSFRDDTRAAFAFYEKALGARIEAMMSYADMPAPAAPDAGCADVAGPGGDGIMHARLALPGGAMLFAGDTPPGMPYEGVKGVMLAVQYDSIDQAHSAFHALSQGGRVTMPLAPAFWAKTFGMLTDRFGVSWAVNGEPIAFAGGTLKYLCLVYLDAEHWNACSDQECAAYVQQLEGGRRLLAAEPLHGTHTATTVRVRNGEMTLFDGPFAETKEMLAGFYLVDAKDLNEAIQLAAGIPPAQHGSIEVRPVRELQVAPG